MTREQENPSIKEKHDEKNQEMKLFIFWFQDEMSNLENRCSKLVWFGEYGRHIPVTTPREW